MMPPRGAPARAETVGTVQRISHEMFVSDQSGRLIEAAASHLDGAAPDSDEASLVRVVRRRWEKARRVPSELAADLARAASVGQQAWIAARRESDFAGFVPYLERNFELVRRYVDCFDDVRVRLRPPARRLRAGCAHGRSRPRVQRAQDRAPGADRGGGRPRRPRRRLHPARSLPGRPAAAAGGMAARADGLRPRELANRRRRPPVRDRLRQSRRPHHHPLGRALPAHFDVRCNARMWPRSVRGGRGRVTPAHAPGSSRVARPA